MLRTHHRHQLPKWPEWSRTAGPKVLVENHDYGDAFATECALERLGYDVAVCGGPDHLDGRMCALFATGDCALLKEADVVVHGLNLDREQHRSVLAGIRSRHPELPVVVEAPRPAIERHPHLLHGCVTVPFPARRDDLEAGIQRALHLAEA